MNRNHQVSELDNYLLVRNDLQQQAFEHLQAEAGLQEFPKDSYQKAVELLGGSWAQWEAEKGYYL